MLVDYFHVKLRQSVSTLIPLVATVEVISVSKREICPVPGVHPALLGVVNHYGRLLWVLELSDFLDLPEPLPNNSRETLTLVVLKDESQDSGQTNPGQVGCVVSSLQEIISLEPDQFQPVLIPELLAADSFVAETTTIHDHPAAILDVASLFARLQLSDSTVSLVF